MGAKSLALAILAALAVAAVGCGGGDDDDSDRAATAPPEPPSAERLLREAEDLAADLAAVGVALLQGGEAAERARAELPRLRDRARDLAVAAADRVAGSEDAQRELARVTGDIAATVESLVELAERIPELPTVPGG